MSRFLLFLVSAVVANAVQGLSPASQPLPPVNWEAQADPRFQPPVEQAVIDLTKHNRSVSVDVIREYWQDWGLDALAVLEAMSIDARWKDYAPAISKVLFLCPLPAGQSALSTILQRSAEHAATVGFQWKSCSSFYSHLEHAKAYNPAVLRGLLQHPIAGVRFHGARAWLNHYQKLSPPVSGIIDTFAAAEDPAIRTYAAALLGLVYSEENNRRALAIAETVSDDLVKRTIAYQARKAPYARAQEPMALILQKETPR
jgi:hypothetical protein